MKKTVILIFILSIFSLLSDEYRSYDYEPILVEKDFVFDKISKLDQLNLVVCGAVVINDDPNDYISNTTIYKSTDIGSTWTQIYIDTNERLIKSERSSLNIIDIHYLSKDIIIAINRTGYLFKTYDGGKNWIKDSIDIALDFFDSKFIDDKNGIILCNRNLGPFKSRVEFIKTSDAGQSWQEIRIPIDSIMNKSTRLYTREFSFTKNGFFQFTQISTEPLNDSIVNNETHIIKTFDMGNTWEKILLFKQDSINIREPKTNKYISTNIQFTSENDAFWMGATPSQTLTYGINSPWEYPFLRRSTDGGQSWSELFYDQDSSKRSNSPNMLIKEDDDKYIFKDGISNILVFEKGTDKYVSIEPNNFPYLNKSFNYSGASDFIYLGDDKFIVSGNSDYIFKFNYSVPTSVSEKVNMKNMFSLYPNPVDKRATIEFELTSSTLVNMGLYNLDGNKLTTLISKKMPMGNYDITLIPNNLTSGAYFIQMTTDYGTFIRKVIVK